MSTQKPGMYDVFLHGNSRPGWGFLRNALVTMMSACLLGWAPLNAGFCQTPGYGNKPDQWAPYESGTYFQRLQEIQGIHGIADSKISYLHFEETDVGVGPVDLFRFRMPVGWDRDCSGNDCYLFALASSDHSAAPLVTPCQFKWALTTHLFNHDGSRAFGFEFSCTNTLLQVRVTPTHMMAISVEKTK